MGRLTYEGTVKAEFEDRLLLHLQTVIGTKLRRGEGFYFSFKDDGSVSDGRTTVWIHPQASLVYKYFGSRMPQINRAWLEALIFTANSPTGLHIVPEPPDIGEAENASDEVNVA